MSSAARLQAEYYTRTAGEYEKRHGADREHDRALEIVSGDLASLGATSALDVGTGTGRALRFLAARHPRLELHGVEPVAALAERAIADHDIAADVITVASGEALPFGDRSLDVVMSFGVLHHVEHPGRVIAEMQRVARLAVFVSDDNRFGAGRWPVRIAKLALAEAGLWPAVDRLKTRGRGYRLSASDGLSYSYSVYDDLPRFDGWQVRLLATDPRPRPRPRLTSSHVLLCARR